MENSKGIKEIKRLFKILSKDNRNYEEWKHSVQNCEKVHRSFLIALIEINRTITLNKLKRCAYLQMSF